MEELLRQAFQLGQQWVKDMNDNIDPISFNNWYSSKEVQEELNKSDDIKHLSIDEITIIVSAFSDLNVTNKMVDNYMKSNKL